MINRTRNRAVVPRLLLLSILLPAAATASDEVAAVLWPEQDRAFFQDGPGLLLADDERDTLLALDDAARGAWIEQFLAADPDPATPTNELTEAIRRRTELVRRHYLSPREDRARVMFLNGEPNEVFEVECGQTFVALEIWSYGSEDDPEQLVFYKRGADQPYRLWLPLDTKRVLYTSEMEYWIEQWEELPRWARRKRFDLQACPDTKRVDRATGVEGLTGYRDGRVTRDELRAFLRPRPDLATWAVAVARQDPAEVADPIPVDGELQVQFPERLRQRIVTRFVAVVPDGSVLGVSEEGERAEWIVGVEGVIEHGAAIFDRFTLRYKLEPQAAGEPIALVLERPLRAEREFVVHLRIEDQVGGGVVHLSRGFEVPPEPQPVDDPALAAGALVAIGRELDQRRAAGADSLLLVPPDSDIELGLWRAEALVTGDRITKVAFLLDGDKQLTRGQPPFSAELRLAKYPKEQVVRAEGYDAAGELVDADEVILNQPRGALRVRILEPQQGVRSSGPTTVSAEVIVPDDRRVEQLLMQLNDETVATVKRPPWSASIDIPPSDQVSYLTLVAELDDGSRAEAVRFVNAPEYLEAVDVNLVELYTTVIDRSGRPVIDLAESDFRVFEDERPQALAKFELVEDLPLYLGVTIDTSGSMTSSLPEAKRAALEFLESTMTPKDSAFAIAFAGRPALLIPATDDLRAIEIALEDLRSYGSTSLHDAIITSLYHFRGVRGRRALILLSDGDDSSSSLPFEDALEYARRSGVSIYSIGLDVGKLQQAVRKKLTSLAEETGGRVFFIQQAAELAGVYEEIERELRSQYLLAYASDAASGGEDFRSIEVKMVEGRLKARTISGYYP